MKLVFTCWLTKAEWQFQGISWLSTTFLFPVLFWDLKKIFWRCLASRMSPCKKKKKAAPLMLQTKCFFLFIYFLNKKNESQLEHAKMGQHLGQTFIYQSADLCNTYCRPFVIFIGRNFRRWQYFNGTYWMNFLMSS